MREETVAREVIIAEEPKGSVSIESYSYFDDDMKFFIKKGSHKKIFTYFKDLFINRTMAKE